MNKIKDLFDLKALPEEVKDTIRGARDARALIKTLDLVLTKNEIEYNELKKDIARVEGLLKAEEGKIQAETLRPRQKRYTLLSVKHLRAHLNNLDHRMDIYDANINLHITLISRVQDIEAMSAHGVNEEAIDKIILDFGESLNQFGDTVRASTASLGDAPTTTAEYEKELYDLEKMILAEAPKCDKDIDSSDTRQPLLQ